MGVDNVINQLLDSEVPSIRYKTRVNVLGEDPASRPIGRLQSEIEKSPLVAALLQGRDGSGRITQPQRVYAKWQGAHWVMATLADIGYPSGDTSLVPIRDQLQEHWLGANFFAEFEAASRTAAYRGEGVPVMDGRHRRCASQQSNALWSILTLGLANEQTHDLAERLLYWQWPDGGWNCDKNPAACHSSFMESILPLRALALFGRVTDNPSAREAAAQAADIFLKRHLFLRQAHGSVIRKEFTALHYPLYWHYDILHGLKVMAEAGFADDPRCERALDLLVSKRLPDGGWPAERKYYKTSDEISLGSDHINWGGTSSRKMNPWVTADALFVLKNAGIA
jgi:hypothetical protein